MPSSTVAVNYQVSAPSGMQLEGNCAEWIVEAPALDGDPDSPLSNFGSVQFSGCTAAASDGSSLSSTDGTCLDMVRDGKTLSSAVVPGAG